MVMISASLARSPIARFSPEELAYWGDGLVRNAGVKHEIAAGALAQLRAVSWAALVEEMTS